MPDRWKSGVVSVRTETGQILDGQMQEIETQIHRITTARSCCGSESESEERKLRQLKASMEDFMQNKVAAFFASRDEMYKSYLLTNPNLTAESTAVESEVNGPASKATGASWPENTTPLFQQVMFLVRDLEDMFKASYNQRFGLRVMDNEIREWTGWTQNELSKLMPVSVVLQQNTLDVYDLYTQAVKLYSYYNGVFASVAKDTKAQWIPAPLKTMFRILEKAKLEIKDGHPIFDCSNIFDIVRGTLVYDSLTAGDGLLSGVRAVFASKEFQVMRVEDHFTNPTLTGWRDVVLTGHMVTSDDANPHLVEVQFHLKDLREERETVGGHFIHERHRALFEACQTACGREARAMLEQLHGVSTNAERGSGKVNWVGSRKAGRSNQVVPIY